MLKSKAKFRVQHKNGTKAPEVAVAQEIVWSPTNWKVGGLNPGYSTPHA